MNANFEKLAMRSGGYSLPFLIKLHDSDNNIILNFINDVADLTYNGTVYKASTFNYKPNDAVCGFDGGGSLEISAVDKNGKQYEIVDLVRRYRDMRLEVVGVLLDEEVSPISKYKHHYGKVNIKENTLSFNFTADDRLQMTFPALIWNNSNNRGNA